MLKIHAENSIKKLLRDLMQQIKYKIEVKTMEVGQVLNIGGNQIQQTKKGNFRVTNSQGKTKTFSEDEVILQLAKNSAKVQNKEEFEFKKDHKNAIKIGAGIAAGAALTAGIIYRKNIGKFFTNIGKKIKNLFKKRVKDNGNFEELRNMYKNKTEIANNRHRAFIEDNFTLEGELKNLQRRKQVIEDAREAYSK